jgi:hypothetical protein
MAGLAAKDPAFADVILENAANEAAAIAKNADYQKTFAEAETKLSETMGSQHLWPLRC